MVQMNVSAEQNRDTDVENKHMDTKEERGDRINWKDGIYIH